MLNLEAVARMMVLLVEASTRPDEGAKDGRFKLLKCIVTEWVE